jgi:hypothetical protein
MAIYEVHAYIQDATAKFSCQVWVRGAIRLQVKPYRFCGDRGAGREQVELGSGLRHEQEGRESRGKKGGRELLEKRRGTSASLYLAKDRAGR